MGFLLNLGKGLAKKAVGGALGLGIGAIQNKMEDKRMKKQFELNKQMALYNHQLGLDMFEKTGPDAIARQLEKAGLDKSLMYNNGQAGGGTVAQGSGEGVSAPNPMGIQMGLQAAQAQANIDLTKAQTEKTKEEADQLGGIDKETKIQKLENLKQVNEQSKTIVDNLKKDGKLKDFQLDLNEILRGSYMDDGDGGPTTFVAAYAQAAIQDKKNQVQQFRFSRMLTREMEKYISEIAGGNAADAQKKFYDMKITENDYNQIEKMNEFLENVGGEGDEWKLLKTLFKGLLLLRKK